MTKNKARDLILERIARAITRQLVIQRREEYAEWNPIEIAQAALSVLDDKVTFLMEGEEPQEGDVVICKKTKASIRVDETFDARAYQNNVNVPDFTIKFSSSEIIQRNNKPVITVEKEDG